MKNICFVFIIMIVVGYSKSFAQDQKNEILDPIPPPPAYSFKYDPIVTLPDSLGGKTYQGLVAIEAIITDNLNLKSIKINKLFLITCNNDTVINYYFGQNNLSLKNIYPPTVMKYVPFLTQYAHSIKITKIEGGDKRSNRLNILLRIK
jgi:hypothetical protein